jgi:hypothetical protein
VPYAGLPYTAQAYMTVTASPGEQRRDHAVRQRLGDLSPVDCVPARCRLARHRAAVDAAERQGRGRGSRAEFDRCSLRSLVCYEPGTDQPVDRQDVLFGYFWPRGEWAVQTCD